MDLQTGTRWSLTGLFRDSSPPTGKPSTTNLSLNSLKQLRTRQNYRSHTAQPRAHIPNALAPAKDRQHKPEIDNFNIDFSGSSSRGGSSERSTWQKRVESNFR